MRKKEFPCYRCHLVKPRTAYPHARSGRICRVCFACVEAEAHALNERGWPRTMTWEENGVKVRRCLKCEMVHPLESYYVNSRKPDGSINDRQRYCKKCALELATARLNVRRADPIEGPPLRKQQAERAKASRERNPEAYKAAKRRYNVKLKRNPEMLAKRRESMRIAHRLKREREGTLVKKQFPKAMRIKESPDYRPAAPLAAFVEKYAGDRPLGEVCKELGIEERGFRRWRSGESQSVPEAIAERVIVHADVGWETIWPNGEVVDRFGKSRS